MATFRFKSKSQGGNASATSAGCLGIFGALFACGGIFFTIFVAKDFMGTVDARGWDQVPAILDEAEIEASRGKENPFAILAKFTYEVGGRSFTSDRFALKETRSDNYEKLALKLKSLREQRDLVAFVDPDEPSTAVLEPGSLASGFTILLPLVFVAIGVGCLIGAFGILRRRKEKNGTPEVEEAISSSPTKKSGGAIVGIIFGAIFAVAGIGAFYALAIKPFTLSKAAQNWIETPCKIIWADVKSHDSDDGTTYSVDIFYAYEFDDQAHRSNRYSFMVGSSSGRKGKQEVVDRYRKSKAPVCYVDPELPERAVLVRELGAAGFLALIPVIFILVGGFILFFSLRHWKKERAAAGTPGMRLTPKLQTESPSAARILSPGKSRLTSVIVLLFVTLFWNGIVFGLLFPEAWLGGGGGIFLKLFSIPFILIGVFIALGFIFSILTLFNPKPVLTLEPGEPELGVPAFLKWHFKGSTGRLRKTRILVRGSERASYRRGTDTVTDTRNFYAIALSEETHAMAMRAGSTEFTLPMDLMYSLELANNAIVWNIEVKGEIAFWPDASDTFEIVVRPHPMPQ